MSRVMAKTMVAIRTRKRTQAQRRRGLPLLTWTVRSDELRRRAESHADAEIAEGAGVST